MTETSRKTTSQKWIYILPSNVAIAKFCSVCLLVTEHTQSKYARQPSIPNKKHEKLPPSFALILQITENLVISRCCCAEYGKEMYKHL